MSIFSGESRSHPVEKLKSVLRWLWDFRISIAVFDSFPTGFPQKKLSFPQTLLER
ncbi:MAG: hypothetical protein KME10_15720 [Plectolyngbya sp. WJT66-NPBG17]|nr:hypothetical protein [Plectolyngbya sp. WJT66-NPBG17]MBW4526075.1 hypothetical protein [Phormidium tanganyikae FI6-MK23]